MLNIIMTIYKNLKNLRDVAEQWKNNEVEAIHTAQQWTKLYANGSN